jgi:hypothetical protein
MNKYPHLKFFDIVNHSGILSPQEQKATIFDATEIAEALDKVVGNDEDLTYPTSYYERCNPPFVDKPFWIESTTLPSMDNLTEKDIREYQEFGGTTREEVIGSVQNMSHSTIRRGAMCMATMVADEHVRWRMIVKSLNQIDENNNPFDTPIIYPDAWAFLEWDHDGYLITDPHNTLVSTGYNDYEIAKLCAGMVTNTLPFLLLSLSFIHRRTVVEYTKPNRAVRKQAARLAGQKRGAMPLKDFYFIKVTPHPRGTDVISANEVKPLLTRSSNRTAQYEVMGHFRSVGPGGLFGKGYLADQIVWIPDYDKGDPELGKLNRGYKLKEK